MKSTTFIGVLSGDGECFCWSGVSKEDKIVLMGQEAYEQDRAIEEDCEKESCADRGVAFDEERLEVIMSVLYPADVLRNLGCEDDKKYRFTISVEEV